MIDTTMLTDLRVRDANRIQETWAARARRPLLGDDGRLLIVAADHPARGALGIRGDAHAMASRPDLLDRLATALSHPGVDGVLGTPDVLDDLLLMGALEHKLAIGSLNRGGIKDSVFEMDDRFTAYSPSVLAAQSMEGGKTLTRICLSDPGTVATLEATANAVTELADHGMMALVEPFVSVREGGKITNLLDAENTILAMSIASALGATSAHTWLKVPVVEDVERVMRSTTLPTLLLGGDPSGDPQETYRSWEHALGLPPVRGLVVGRALLYPQDDDVVAAVDTAAAMVHPRTRYTGD